MILGNTYHLMLRPGADLIAELGGLHGFADWTGHVLTDSGGYQVFSLEPKVTDDGATFRSTYDGSTHHLTPEGGVAIQQQLGADIQMVLDVCPPLPSTGLSHPGRRRPHRACGRDRAKAAHAPGPRRGLDAGPVRHRAGRRSTSTCGRESAERTVELGFDGYGIGGLSVGETRDEMLPALAAATAELPADQPRYLMGVGDPVGIVEAVALGIDMFDCVLPTRLARHGTILTAEGRLNLRNAQAPATAEPLDPAAPARPAPAGRGPTCATC